MKIYTKTGDDGTTGLFGGPRVLKNDARIAAYGTVDELNSLLGVVIATMNESISQLPLVGVRSEESLRSVLEEIQSDLFAIGSELATPSPETHAMRLLGVHRVQSLEDMIDGVQAVLPPLTNFILPGGNTSAAYLHYARTVCRRAERDLIGLMQSPDVADYGNVLVYLNRLSDFLFVLARLVNHRTEATETIWRYPTARLDQPGRVEPTMAETRNGTQ